MTLVEFLRARLAEDEAAARAASPGPWHAATHDDGYSVCIYGPERPQDGGRAPGSLERRQVMKPWVVAGPGHAYGGVSVMEDGDHIARHDPARVLAEVEAKRRIVDQLAEATARCIERPESYMRAEVGNALLLVARHLALPYADHPDYDESWRPDAG